MIFDCFDFWKNDFSKTPSGLAPLFFVENDMSFSRKMEELYEKANF